MKRLAIIALLILTAGARIQAQHGGHGTHADKKEQHGAEHHGDHGPKGGEHGPTGHDGHGPEAHGDHAEHKPAGPFDPTDVVMHHISDANEFHIIGDLTLPLPCILYSSDAGLTTFMSSKFEHGHKAVNGYVLVHGDVMRATGLPTNEVIALDEIHDAHGHGGHGPNFIKTEKEVVDGKEVEVQYVSSGGAMYKLERAASLDGGLLGGGWTSFIDFSITKNVFTMLMAFVIMGFVFFGISRRYKNTNNGTPKGVQSLLEPVFVFMRDEVIKPSIGPRYERYMPFLMSVFFFILINNLFGLIPFFPGSSNVTGSVSVTLGMAFFVFLIVNFSGNKHYWQHIFWMPDVPVFVKILLLPIELIGIFIKPFTLLIRLFANITAGHIVILSLVSLVFVFGNLGESTVGGAAGGVIATVFVFIMNLLELLVAFLQAFIFTLLSSLYIGSAVEEHHHDEHEHEHAAEHAH